MTRDSHFSEAEISAASDSDRPRQGVREQHLAHCAACRARLAESIVIRQTVARVGDERVEPEHDLAERALAVIRRRERAVASVNDTVGTFAGIARAAMHFAFGRRT